MDKTIKIEQVKMPKRTYLVKWSQNASDYFEYAQEVGCGIRDYSSVWDYLETKGEPVGLWVPEHLRPRNTGEYVHGVEVPKDYTVEHEGYSLLEVDETDYLKVQGEPFNDEDFQEAISLVKDEMNKIDFDELGVHLALDQAPRLQLAVEGHRGYVEYLPVLKK